MNNININHLFITHLLCFIFAPVPRDHVGVVVVVRTYPEFPTSREPQHHCCCCCECCCCCCTAPNCLDTSWEKFQIKNFRKKSFNDVTHWLGLKNDVTRIFKWDFLWRTCCLQWNSLTVCRTASRRGWSGCPTTSPARTWRCCCSWRRTLWSER